jgi:hypothetical protein
METLSMGRIITVRNSKTEREKIKERKQEWF